MCDFTSGFQPPEMVAPHQIEAHHYEIRAGAYDLLDPTRSVWAKCDMLTCVCFERLDRLLLYGRYQAPMLRFKDLQAIQVCVSQALQLDVEQVKA